MKQRTFKVLCDALRPLLNRQQNQLRPTVPIDMRISVALWYLAIGIDFQTLAELFGLGKDKVHSIVWKVCVATSTIQGHFINLPKGEKLHAVVEGFRETWGFPQCAGAIDGSQIPVTPPFEDAKDYFNWKGSYSIILHSVVDHKSR